MNENENISYEMDAEDDVMLPDGWAEGDDYFDSGSWTGNAEGAGAAPDSEAEPGAEESAIETAEEHSPATESGNEGELDRDTESETPATETPAARPEKIKVTYQFNHEDVSEEIDPADLPEIMQMARSSARYKEKAAHSEEAQGIHEKTKEIAKILGYGSPMELIEEVLKNARNNEREALLAKGNSEEIVDDFLDRKYTSASVPQQTEPEKPAEKPAENQFAVQARELLAARPNLSGKKLPDEVIAAVASGKSKSLLEAYVAYEEAERTAEINRVRKENEILKQNAASASRAPVSGVSKGGSAHVAPEDDFLRGFNSDY